MSISISQIDNVGITVESDPTAVKKAGDTMSGVLYVPEIRNLLNTELVIDSYNDTGAGTHYEHKFTPFDGKFVLATNGGGLVFPDGTTQNTASVGVVWGEITGTLSSQTDLNTALDGKSATTHLHTGVYAPVVHNHVIGDTTGLQTALDGKSATTHLHAGVYAPVAHSHVIGDTTGLQTALDNKASLSGATFTGKIGIGVAPSTTAAINVDAGGIMFSDGTTQTTASVGGGGAVTSVAGRTGVITLSNTDISGLGTMATATASDYSTKTVADGLYYPLSSNPAGYLTSASYPVTSVAGRTGAITLSNTDISGLGTLAVVNDAPSDGSEYVRKNATWSVATGGGSSFITSVTSPLAVASGNLTVDLSAKADLAGATFTGIVSGIGFGTVNGMFTTTGTGGFSATGSGNISTNSGNISSSSGNITAYTGNIYANSGSINTARFIGTPAGGVSALNIGIGGNSTTSTTAGDMWISTGGATINYRDGIGTWRTLAALNNANQFTQGQAISVTSTSNAFRINQLGTGPALVVEDSTNPDTSSFVISATGSVGIGVNPATYNSTYKLEVQGNSLFSNNVYIASDIVLTNQVTQSHTNAFTVYNNEIKININGVDRWIPIR